MTNLQKCTPAQLDKIIRDAVVTNPWSDVNKFPDMKRTTVICSQGFSNSDGDPRVIIEEEADQDEDSIFESKKEEMQKHGLRLVTGLIDLVLIYSILESSDKSYSLIPNHAGEEYAVFLRMRNRPTIIPLWMPLSVSLAIDTTVSRPILEIDCERSNLDHSEYGSTGTTISETRDSIPTTITTCSEQSCTDSVPDSKRIRCGTRADCMDEDETDASNAVTVEWARA
jgi:hypothetical protein